VAGAGGGRLLVTKIIGCVYAPYSKQELKNATLDSYLVLLPPSFPPGRGEGDLGIFNFNLNGI